MSATTGLTEEQKDQIVVNDEYKLWKKNCVYLYDMVMSHSLVWPSLTVQWFSDIQESDDGRYVTQRLLLGTHTSDNDHNYVHILKVTLPTAAATAQSSKRFASEAAISVEMKIPHKDEVNRARYMPQNPNLLSTKSRQGSVFLFDVTKHDPHPRPGTACTPQMILSGHSKEGYGLDWHHTALGHLVSGSDDHLVCYWDIQANAEKASLPPTRVFNHGAVVEDVQWHPKHVELIASVGDDGCMKLWDRRTEAKAVHVAKMGDELRSIDFSPHSDYLVATGGCDTNAHIWDIRALGAPLHVCDGHTGTVEHVQWNPHNEAVLSTSGSDRRSMVWDLSLIGAEQTDVEAGDGAPELLFVHGGHTASVTQGCWNPRPEYAWTNATISEDNILQIWQPASAVYQRDI